MEMMTYVDALNFAITSLEEAVTNSNNTNWRKDAEEVINKLTTLKTQTIKRNSTKSKKEVAKQNENSALGAVVLEVLATCEEPVTVTELMALDSRFDGLKVQKISPIMRKLLAENQIVRLESKHKAYFALKRED